MQKLKNFRICSQILEQDNESGAVYLGDITAAMNFRLLFHLNIKAVLTTARGCFINLSAWGINQSTLAAPDLEQFQISKAFTSCYNFIENNRAILIHCIHGISQSPTIIISYLMKKFNWSFEEAFKFMKSKKNNIQINSGFQKQLISYEKQLQTENQQITQEEYYNTNSIFHKCYTFRICRNKSGRGHSVDNFEEKKRPCNMKENLINRIDQAFNPYKTFSLASSTPLEAIFNQMISAKPIKKQQNQQKAIFSKIKFRKTLENFKL